MRGDWGSRVGAGGIVMETERGKKGTVIERREMREQEEEGGRGVGRVVRQYNLNLSIVVTDLHQLRHPSYYSPARLSQHQNRSLLIYLSHRHQGQSRVETEKRGGGGR